MIDYCNSQLFADWPIGRGLMARSEGIMRG
jgi:hypothetical protein